MMIGVMSTDTNLSWRGRLMMITFIFQATLAIGTIPLSVRISSNATTVVCYNQSIELTCHADSIDMVTYKWISTKLKQPKDTATIIVIATDNPVEYICEIITNSGEKGSSNICISSNASVPDLYAVNFYNGVILTFADSYVYLIVQIMSNLPLTKIPMWSRQYNRTLSNDSYATNYAKDGKKFNSLIIDKVSYNDDGVYYIAASNYCGTSSISVRFVIFRKGSGCQFIGQGIPFVSSSGNQTTIEGEVITFMCLFRKHFIRLKYYVQWAMNLQNGSTIELKDDNNSGDYHFSTKNFCPYSNSSCCHFITELSIHAAISLNNTNITCTAVVNGTHLSTSDTSYLMVVERPILTARPADASGVKKHKRVHLEAHFNASMIPNLALCGWKKDGNNASNGKISQTSEQGYKNHLICGFTIDSVSETDEGTYSSYSYYNKSFSEQFHFKNVKSQYAEAVVRLEEDNPNSHNPLFSGESIAVFVILCVVAFSCPGIVWCLAWPVYRYHNSQCRERQKAVDVNKKEEIVNERTKLLDEKFNSASVTSQTTGNITDTSSNNNELTEDRSNSSVMTGQPTDNMSHLLSDDNGSVASIKVDDNYSHPSNGVTPANTITAEVNHSNNDNSGIISRSIIITEQPKNQTVQFKRDEKTIKLTCCAISDGNKLYYEWYCSDSSKIISNNCCAQIKLKRPYKNMEKQYFCKIFIADQLKCCVESEKAKVKLEIVWITEPILRPSPLVVCSGKKLELLCKAEAAPGLKKEYYWFRYQKDAYRSQKKRIESKGNKMTIAECTDAKGGHYLCEVAAIDEQRNHIWSINAVFHVKVVNSTKITIIKQPPHEMLVTLGVELTLECEALCGHHPIKYQWYHKTKPVADATQSMLAIKSVSEEDIGSYWCEITSNYCETRAVSRVTDVRENYSTSSDQSRYTQREDTVSLMESVEEVGRSLPETSFSSSWNQLQYEVYSSSCSQSQHDQLEAEKHLTHKNRRYAKDKMALLIGNSGYEKEPLRCAKNDVKAIKEKLEQRNFRTILLVDLTLLEMINAVEYFCSLLDKGMYAIFYYSGHGVEINKTTYFVPVDADEKNINPTQYTNSDLIGYKLQSTLAKVIMILDCCRKTFPEELQIPPVPFSGNLSIANICKIYACISSFEAVEMNNDDNSLMAMALLRSLDCSEKGQTFYDLYKCVEKYYHEHNVSTQSGKSFIRAEMVKILPLDFSLDDPVLSSSMSKARDLLLVIPEKYCLKFNHPVMERTYGESVSLHFKAVYSNVVTLHIYCDVAEGPILRDMKLSCNSGLSVVKLKSEGVASYEISNLLVLMDLAGSYPKLQFTFQMPHDENTTDLIEYKIPSDLIRLK